MKRIVVALLVLMFAAPAWAQVLITCSQGPHPYDPNVIISFVNTEPQHVRAFALDITLDDGGYGGPPTITAVECLSDDYYVYLGSIQISDNEVTNPGTCVCDSGQYDDTLPGLDSNGVTIEMASLYSVNDPDHNSPPADSGNLLKITFDGIDFTCFTIRANNLRGGVVMEDATSVEPNAPGYCAEQCDTCLCGHPEYDLWLSVGRPIEWCYSCHRCGDINGDCQLTFADVSKVIAAWPPNPYDPNADLARDGQMTFADVAVLINNWPPNGACDNCGSCTPMP